MILTSGTTGAPKGAQRKEPRTLDPAASLLSKIPLRARERTLVAAPLFHSWGLAHLVLGLGLSSTLVLHRRFDPEQTLGAIDEHGVTALVIVPVMLQRILERGPKVVRKYDTGSLRVIAASGSVLPGELATDVMDTFGDVLYNLYGSTEVAWATIATPAELRAAPGTAGRPPRGTIVRLYDAAGAEVRAGETGRIFVRNELVFDGYTGGGGKAVIDGLVVVGRRRALRRGGAPVRRRPRRRDDRLGRRERLPARGRGRDRRARRRRRGRRDRRRRRPVRPAPARLRRAQRGRGSSPSATSRRT